MADANGNCVTFSDDAGNVQAHYVFDAFGGTVSQDGDMADYFRFRFSSKYLDDETGFYYYGYRYYDPVTGRWLNRDPIEESGGVNVYLATKNRPINVIDPLGLSLLNLNLETRVLDWACDKSVEKHWESKKRSYEIPNILTIEQTCFYSISVNWTGTKESDCNSSLYPVTHSPITHDVKLDSVFDSHIKIAASGQAGNVSSASINFGFETYYENLIDWGYRTTLDHSAHAKYQKWIQPCCTCAVATFSVDCSNNIHINDGAIGTAAVFAAVIAYVPEAVVVYTIKQLAGRVGQLAEALL